MKIAVKSKAEPQQTLRLRVPQSLKEHMDTTRKLADECGVDWNATMVEAIARFATDLHSQLAQSRSKTVPKGEHQTSPGNGTKRSPNLSPDPPQSGAARGQICDPKLDPEVVE